MWIFVLPLPPLPPPPERPQWGGGRWLLYIIKGPLLSNCLIMQSVHSGRHAWNSGRMPGRWKGLGGGGGFGVGWGGGGGGPGGSEKRYSLRSKRHNIVLPSLELMAVIVLQIKSHIWPAAASSLGTEGRARRKINNKLYCLLHQTLLPFEPNFTAFWTKLYKVYCLLNQTLLPSWLNPNFTAFCTKLYCLLY